MVKYNQRKTCVGCKTAVPNTCKTLRTNKLNVMCMKCVPKRQCAGLNCFTIVDPASKMTKIARDKYCQACAARIKKDPLAEVDTFHKLTSQGRHMRFPGAPRSALDLVIAKWAGTIDKADTERRASLKREAKRRSRKKKKTRTKS